MPIEQKGSTSKWRKLFRNGEDSGLKRSSAGVKELRCGINLRYEGKPNAAKSESKIVETSHDSPETEKEH